MAEYLIVTGLSGAGRSTVAATLEDLGWLVIDNLPPSLIPQVSALALPGGEGGETEKVALVSGRSGGAYVQELTDGHRPPPPHDRRPGAGCCSSTPPTTCWCGARGDPPPPPGGRRHGGGGIARERRSLASIKAQADIRIDTTELNVHQLRERLVDMFDSDPKGSLRTSVVSFGYQHGIPLDVDLVFDCRFLPNPHWVERLRPAHRPRPGRPRLRDGPARHQGVPGQVGRPVLPCAPRYVKEGKTYLSVAVGCTGGRHRSVVLAEAVARSMEAHGFNPVVNHRDLER